MSEAAATRTVAATRPRLLEDGGLVVLAYCFPPISVGPSFLIDRLLSGFDLTDTLLFAGEPDRFHFRDDRGPATQVEVRRRDVPRWWPQDDTAVTVRHRRVPLRLRAVGNVLVALRVAVEATQALRNTRARGLLVVYPKQHFLLAACVAAALTRKPLLVYFMDVYVEALPRGRRVARIIERYVLRRAAVLFAMSDAHREQLEARLRAIGVQGARVVEIPHMFAPVEVVAIDPAPGRPSIVFTGAIYGAQADAIRRLIDALDHPMLGGLDPRLHLLSPMDAQTVASFGVRTGARVQLRAGSSVEAVATQRVGDILFLPISFDLTPDQARTASPSKLPEYLAARRPILVHAPPDSYVARYARAHGFAEVVDVPEVEAVAAAVRRLATDAARRTELVRAAAETLGRHRMETVAAVFRAAVRDAVGAT